MQRIKLLSDFDGIWTNQEEEAKYMESFIVNKLATITKKSELEINRIIFAIKEAMNETPHLYGWRYKGETPAFYLEDPFGDNNAFFDFLEQNYRDESYDIDLRKMRKMILDAGFESLEDFSNFCFTESAGRFKEAGKLKPHIDAPEVVDKLMKQGIELVVASNSNTEKIEYLFEKLGYKMNEEITDSRGKIRARGNSMKFAIDTDFKELPPYMDISDNYKIPLRRKFYFELLHEEIPDYVLGDVFSLDIALPLYLGLHNEKFRGMKIIQKIQKYTPDWVKNYLKKEEFGKIVYTTDDIKELPKILQLRSE